MTESRKTENKGMMPPVYKLKIIVYRPLIANTRNAFNFHFAQVMTISAINSFTATMKSHSMMRVIMTDTRCSTFAYNTVSVIAF